MMIWTCGSSPQSGSRNAWTRIKNVNYASRPSNFWNFFDAIQMISCRDWWPCTKPGYITMTRRQSNNQWSGGIAAHPAPKSSECKNRLEKFSPRFFGIKTASASLALSSIRPNYQRGLLSISAGAIEGHFEENPAGRSPRGSCCCTTMPRTGQVQPRRNWSTWASNVFITHPFSGSGPVGLPPVLWTEKNNWKVTIFRPTGRSLLPRRPGWTDNFLNFFLSGLQKLEQRVKKCIELRGECVE